MERGKEAAKAAAPDRDIVVTRLINAPREKVFKAFTESQQLLKWWGPYGFTNNLVELDVQPGGKWKIEQNMPAGDTQLFYGVYKEVVKNEKLVWSFTWGGRPDVEAITEFKFEEESGKTLLTVTTTMPTAEGKQGMIAYGAVQGSNQSYDKLEEFLAGEPTDKELIVPRLLNAPRELVFALWTSPEHIKNWWGPTGFTNTISKMDVREGGEWEFVMHGPDGTDYANRNVFLKIEKNEKIVLSHATGPVFKITAMFVPQGDKTLLTMRSQFESAEQLKAVIEKHKADEGLRQNIEKLQAYVDRMPINNDLVLTRALNAPRDLVFDVWTNPAHVTQWWGPKDFTNPSCKVDGKVGGEIDIAMTGPDGTNYPCVGSFVEVVKPEKLVFTIGAFQDGSGKFRFEVRYTVTLAEENGKTKLTLVSRVTKFEPEFTPALLGMEQGWGESLDRMVSHAEGNSPTNQHVVVERTYNAPVEKVWKALTDKEEMKKWYFDMSDFKPEVGFEFKFSGTKGERTAVHLCKITEVVPKKKLAHTWRYEGNEGDSLVTFEFFAEGDKTRLRVTHTGLETFPAAPGHFAKKNFIGGWTHILGTGLKDYLEGSGK